MNSDALFDEIEQFLADGGEPAEPTPEERMRAAFDAVNRAAKAMVEAMQPVFDAFAKMAEAIHRWWSAFISNLTDWYENVYLPLVDCMRRDQLSAQLESYWVPRPVARWIAARWPKRWLPSLVLPPPEPVAQ